MSNNANIERITFEEIQELKDLNLYDLPAAVDPANLVMLVYDTNTRQFTSSILDASGNITITTDALLVRDITVNTDALPVNRGHVFVQGTAFTDVIDVLCNPPTDSSVVVSIDIPVIEWGVATARTISYVFNQGTETDAVNAATGNLFVDNVLLGPLTPSPGVTIITASVTAESTVVYKVEVDSLNTSLPVKSFSETVSMRVIFPIFIGTGITPAATTPELQDLVTDGFLYCNFPGLAAGFDTHWFAVEQNKIPLRWAEVDAQGIETGFNKGPISTLFEQSGNFQHNGNTFFVYRTVSAKTFPLRIKIDF